jgi:hypothetical protein
MASETGFSKSNHLVQCYGCGRLTWSRYAETKGVNGEACEDCANEWQAENEHNDYGEHRATDTRVCPICHPERHEARLARVAAHNAKIQIKAEAYNASLQARQAAKAENEAAKAAAKKNCQGTHGIFRNGVEVGREACDGRASKTSDYCSICRPYYPHKAVKFTGRVFGNADPATLCGLCGGNKSDKIHEVNA